jgi:hypothetical protein
MKKQAKPFATVAELKAFRDTMQEAARINAQLREMKERAAATLGAADSAKIGTWTLSRETKRGLRFNKDLCISRYGSQVYESCKLETISTSYKVDKD